MEIDTLTAPNQLQENQQSPEILQLMQTMTDLMRQQQELNIKVHSRGSSGLAEFKKLSPPSFEGSTDLLEAEKWLREMEKAFTVLKSIDEEKVLYATYMLQGDAYDW